MEARNLYIDNIKGLAILLVIIGHFLEIVINNNYFAKSIFLFIYTFHIPCFSIISGMLSKNKLSYLEVVKLTEKLFIPFIAFNMFYEIFYMIVFKHISIYILSFSPFWIMWYLLALFFWRFSLPVFSILKHSVIISIIISVILGYSSVVNSNFLNISKIFFFLPFFLIGYNLPKNFFLKNKLSIFLSILIITAIFLLSFKLQNINIGWVIGRFTYTTMGVNKWYAGIFKIIFYIVSFLMVWAVFSLVSNKKTFFSKIGEKSLHIYIWHGFFIMLVQKYNLINLLIAKYNIFIVIFLIIAMSFFISWILSSKALSVLTGSIFQNFSKTLLNI